MDPETFEFDGGLVDQASDEQRSHLERLQEIIRRLAPTGLDLSNTTVAVEAGRLFVTLPHRSQDDQDLALSIRPDEAVVYYGIEHQHFWPEDPTSGFPWPIDAADHVSAAFELLEAVLAGRVELEVREGLVARRTTSLLDDDGDRRVIFRCSTLRRRRGQKTRTVQFDFGVSAS